MKTFDFFPYALPIRNQTGSFQYIEDFSETQNPEYYDALYELFPPTFNCQNIILREAQAPDVVQGVFDFPPCRFTSQKSGCLKIFLYPDHKILGKAEYNAGSKLSDEKIEGKWFLHNDYLYLEIIWIGNQHISYKVWGWTDCLENQNLKST